MERTDGGTDASDFPTSSRPHAPDRRRFRALARREPLLALAVAGLFALAVETAQKPQDFSEPLASSAILPALVQSDTPALAQSRTPALPHFPAPIPSARRRWRNCSTRSHP